MLEEYIRRGWIEEQLSVSRALYRRSASGYCRARALHAGGRALDATEGGFFSWLTIPGTIRRLSP